MNNLWTLFWTSSVLVAVPAWALYWLMFRRVVMAKLRYEVEAVHDELALMELRDEIKQSDREAYTILMKRASESAAALPQIGVLTIALSPDSGPAAKLQAKKENEIISASDRELVKRHQALFNVVLGAAIINSPFTVVATLPISIALVVGSLWFHSLKRSLNDLKALLIAGVHILKLRGT